MGLDHDLYVHASLAAATYGCMMAKLNGRITCSSFIGCISNTLTGNASSCQEEGCQCRPGYLPPDCCQCDTTSFYLPDCKRKSREKFLHINLASYNYYTDL